MYRGEDGVSRPSLPTSYEFLRSVCRLLRDCSLYNSHHGGSRAHSPVRNRISIYAAVVGRQRASYCTATRSCGNGLRSRARIGFTTISSVACACRGSSADVCRLCGVSYATQVDRSKYSLWLLSLRQSNKRDRRERHRARCRIPRSYSFATGALDFERSRSLRLRNRAYECWTGRPPVDTARSA